MQKVPAFSVTASVGQAVDVVMCDVLIAYGRGQLKTLKTHPPYYVRAGQTTALGLIPVTSHLVTRSCPICLLLDV